MSWKTRAKTGWRVSREAKVGVGWDPLPSSLLISPLPSTCNHFSTLPVKEVLSRSQSWEFLLFQTLSTLLPTFPTPTTRFCILPASYFSKIEAIAPDPQLPATAAPSLPSSPFLSSHPGWCFLPWGQALCSGSQPLLFSLEPDILTCPLSPVYSTLSWRWILPICAKHTQAPLKIKQKHPQPTALPAIIFSFSPPQWNFLNRFILLFLFIVFPHSSAHHFD